MQVANLKSKNLANFLSKRMILILRLVWFTFLCNKLQIRGVTLSRLVFLNDSLKIGRLPNPLFRPQDIFLSTYIYGLYRVRIHGFSAARCPFERHSPALCNEESYEVFYIQSPTFSSSEIHMETRLGSLLGIALGLCGRLCGILHRLVSFPLSWATSGNIVKP